MTNNPLPQKLPLWEKGKPRPDLYTSRIITEHNASMAYAPIDLAKLFAWLKNEDK